MATRTSPHSSAGPPLQCVQAAPRLGSEADTEALLGSGEDLYMVGSQAFPAVWWEGGWVPEAKSYCMTVLPHQLGLEIDRVFPRAIVTSRVPPKDLDWEKCDLEKEGERLGMQRLPPAAPR